MQSLMKSVTMAVIALVFASCVDRAHADPIGVPSNDPEIAEAIEKALSTLPEFWKKFENPGAGEDGFALKVRMTTKSGDNEHIWVDRIFRKDGKINGFINNVPVAIPNVRQGSKVEVENADISDWMYLRNDKIVGNETLRQLIKLMPKEEAEEHRAMFAEP